MPGILPMKVIKVGTSAQSRIAQACDRCRSKKIRCDGTRPTCTQCANVGFECRTSDKLSRRAFPRGYTESLEERVRALELEVRDLKDLLDEKDEKIDMLSKMHGNRRRPSITSPPLSNASPESSRKEASPPREDTFKVQPSPLLLDAENSDSYFMGPSSGRAFIECFKRKIQETGKPCSDFNPEAFLHMQGTLPLTSSLSDREAAGAPPRLFSDRCVNVYFQEWAPLFPILHKPTFLHIYEEFVSDPSKIKSNHKTAQLYLVFSIAGLSLDTPDLAQLAACEEQWTKALDLLVMDNTMNALQCLLLALLYFTMRADYKRLQHYKGIAVGLSHRLGLHQSQKRFSFGALTTETRKKVFWTLYTLDCFTAATLGLPKLLKEEDVQAEYPSDTDDEYVTEKGFQPTLPGESTRLSSALALFRATRILARVLENIYPAAPTHELSLQQMESLDSELNCWYDELPSHLRLNFVQDKPSTDVTGSRSPLLALAYYFIKTLIYRPAVGSSLGQKASPALLSISDSSKHIIQIMQLLEERRMIFSFCLNKYDLLMVCGMTLLYQVLDFKQESKLVRDNGRLVNAVIKIVEGAKAPGYWSFKRIAGKLVLVDDIDNSSPTSTSSAVTSASDTNHRDLSPSVQSRQNSSYSMGYRPNAAASDSDLFQQQERMRRLTMPSIDQQRPGVRRSPSRHSLESPSSDNNARRHRLSMSQAPRSYRQLKESTPTTHPNLDYLSLSNTPSQSGMSSPQRQHRNMQPPPPVSSHIISPPHMGRGKGAPATVSSAADWEVLLGTMDGGMNNVYDAIYGGSSFLNEAPIEQATATTATATSQCPTTSDWSPDAWDLADFSIGNDLYGIQPNSSQGQNPGAPQSVLSLSDESLSSGEDAANSDMGLSMGSVDYQNGNMLSACGNGDGYVNFSL